MSHSAEAKPPTDFDLAVDRTGTASQKWSRYQGQNIIPLWVADTDFIAAPAILDALHQRLTHGVLGYTQPLPELNQVVVERYKHLYNWDIEAEWLVWLPGLVCGLHLACRATGEPGSEVLVAPPIYPPFMTSPKLSDRVAIKVPLIRVDGRLVLDFAALENAITRNTRLLLFCNPQNPGGTVYRREELEQLANLCVKHNLVLCSDEVHGDLILEPGVKHIPTGSLDPQIEALSITLNSPSKAFNIAGLACAFAIIPDAQLRRRFNQVKRGIVGDVNLFGYEAALAAYQQGADWLEEQKAYLRANRDYLLSEINQIPGLKLDKFEATYLAWVDVSALELDVPQRFFEEAGVGLSPGVDFGDKDFMRLNFGCRKALLEEAVRRIKSAVESKTP